tara:strand:+ start:235 stop:408 length:174 start_codon:yes stop_codon:yes gene_type:complete
MNNLQTSTAGRVMPITKVYGKLIDLGKVGNIIRKIHKIYWDKHTNNNLIESSKNILK